MQRRVRSGFTLIELLVVIAIIGILVSMLMPAVQKAREAARRAQCLNNMKQVALAMLNRESQHRNFPHGNYNYIDSTHHTPAPYNNTQDRRCWMHDILPYVEQTALYDKFESHMKTGKSALAFPELHVVVPVFVCPSDPVSPKPHTFWGGIGQPTQGFSGNVVANAGSDYFNHGGATESARLNGMFFAQSKVRMAHVKDGSSNTALLSEIILVADTSSHDIRGRYYNPAHGGVLFSTRVPPNTRVPDRFNWCSKTPSEWAPCVWTGTDMFLSARSHHTGGVNMAMVDGSVHFVDAQIDRDVYLALGSRAGKENVQGLGL